MRYLIITLMTLHVMVGVAQGFFAVRAGANLVGNTYRVREAKPEAGGGGSIGAFLSPHWAVEFETWVRAANPECCAISGLSRLSMAIDLRGNGGGSTMIVRATAAMIHYFR